MASKFMNMNMDMDSEYCYEDQQNMEQHLRDFHTSLKMGSPEDALRALQALNASGMRVQSQAPRVVETQAGCGPKPRFAKFVPPVRPVAKPVETVAKPVETVAKPVETVAETVAKTVETVAKTVAKPVEPVEPVLPGVKQERALRKKLERCRALCDKDGNPLTTLNADQTILAKSIKTIEKDLEALEKKNAVLAARTAKRDAQRERRRIEEEEIAKQVALIGEIKPVSTKKNVNKAQNTTRVKNITFKSSIDDDDGDDDHDDDCDDESLLLQLGPRIVGGGSHAQKKDTRTVPASSTCATDTVREKATRSTQYAHYGLSGVVTRWNGKNGHIETFDIIVRGQSQATRVFVDGRWLKSPLTVGDKVVFDTLNGRYGLNAANCVVCR
jgi:SOS-response transcriptional repressor LexA